MDIMDRFDEAYFMLENELKKNIANKVKVKDKKLQLKLERSKLLTETDFKDIGITNKEGREGYVAQETEDMENELLDIEISIWNSDAEIEMLRYRIKYLLIVLKQMPKEAFYDEWESTSNSEDNTTSEGE
jgi:hypothetical protein